MTTVLNESQVLAKTRCQDLYSVFKLNCWGSGINDVSLVRKLVNVEVIGLSSNEITTLEDFSYCTKLKELILRNNKIENIAEVAHLQKLPKLTNLWLQDNPCAENTYNYRKVVLKALPNLTVLDNVPVTREELQEIEELGNEIYEEVPYESYNSSSNSGPNSSSTNPDSSNNQQPAKIQHQQHQPIPASSQPHESSNHEQPITNGNGQQQLQSQDESGSDFVGVLDQQSNFHHQQQQQLNDSVRDVSLNYGPSESRISMSARLSQRPQSRASMLTQPQHCRSLNSEYVSSYGSNQNCSMNNLNCSHINNFNNNNNNNNNCSSKNTGKGNIVSAILFLIKELDYSSCEVVKTALHLHMEEASQ